MLDYKYTEPSTKSSIFRSKDRSKSSKENNFPGINSDVHRCTFDVSWESYFFELFDLPLDVSLVWEINQGYMAYGFFNLKYESVTYCTYHSMHSPGNPLLSLLVNG